MGDDRVIGTDLYIDLGPDIRLVSGIVIAAKTGLDIGNAGRTGQSILAELVGTDRVGKAGYCVCRRAKVGAVMISYHRQTGTGSDRHSIHITVACVMGAHYHIATVPVAPVMSSRGPVEDRVVDVRDCGRAGMPGVRVNHKHIIEGRVIVTAIDKLTSDCSVVLIISARHSAVAELARGRNRIGYLRAHKYLARHAESHIVALIEQVKLAGIAYRAG